MESFLFIQKSIQRSSKTLHVQCLFAAHVLCLVVGCFLLLCQLSLICSGHFVMELKSDNVKLSSNLCHLHTSSI